MYPLTVNISIGELIDAIIIFYTYPEVIIAIKKEGYHLLIKRPDIFQLFITYIKQVVPVTHKIIAVWCLNVITLKLSLRKRYMNIIFVFTKEQSTILHTIFRFVELNGHEVFISEVLKF